MLSIGVGKLCRFYLPNYGDKRCPHMTAKYRFIKIIADDLKPAEGCLIKAITLQRLSRQFIRL